MRAVVVAIWLMTGCGSGPPRSIPRSTVATPPRTTEVERWLARIPDACEATPSVAAAVDCVVDEPAGACVVEQVDVATGTTTDRYVFDGERLVHHAATISDLERRVNVYAYDARGRRVRELECTAAGPGTPSWHPSWREPMVSHDASTTIATRTEIAYVGATTRPAYAETVTTTTTDGTPSTMTIQRCYAYDLQGRRRDKAEVYRQSTQPGTLGTMIRSYVHARSHLSRMTSEYASVSVRPDGPPQLRPGHAWTAVFGHDRHDRPIWVESGGSRTTYGYDTRGRLVRYSSVRIAWDGDRVVEVAFGDPRYDRAYTYDARGRFVEARFGAGGGYRMTYSATCPPTFAHPAITPNVDNFQYYEGKDTL